MQAQIIDKLKSHFKDQALFFWDEMKGKELGVLLRPSFTNEVDFSVLNAQFRTPQAVDEKKVVMKANHKEFIEQIKYVANYLLIEKED